MNDFMTLLGAVAAGAFGVAIVALLVSQQAQTGTVIQASSSGLANVISAATAPVTGQAAAPNVGASSTFSGIAPSLMPAMGGNWIAGGLP